MRAEERPLGIHLDQHVLMLEEGRAGSARSRRGRRVLDTVTGVQHSWWATEGAVTLAVTNIYIGWSMYLQLLNCKTYSTIFVAILISVHVKYKLYYTMLYWPEMYINFVYKPTIS